MILRLGASAAALLGAAGYMREAMSHPSFIRRRFRIAAVIAILSLLSLIEAGIWS
jgi:hypothetical protein